MNIKNLSDIKSTLTVFEHKPGKILAQKLVPRHQNDGHLYGHQGLNYCFLKSRNPLVLLVARGGIEPPTHGFSVLGPLVISVT